VVLTKRILRAHRRGAQFRSWREKTTFTETAVPPYIGFTSDFEISGRPKIDRQSLHIGLIGPHYFETAGIAMIEGRDLTPSEIISDRHLAVINEELRRRYFPSGMRPVGARIHVPGIKINQPNVFTPPGGDQWFQVIGVAATARNLGLQEAPERRFTSPIKR